MEGALSQLSINGLVKREKLSVASYTLLLCLCMSFESTPSRHLIRFVTFISLITLSLSFGVCKWIEFCGNKKRSHKRKWAIKWLLKSIRLFRWFRWLRSAKRGKRRYFFFVEACEPYTWMNIMPSFSIVYYGFCLMKSVMKLSSHWIQFKWSYWKLNTNAEIERGIEKERTTYNTIFFTFLWLYVNVWLWKA